MPFCVVLCPRYEVYSMYSSPFIVDIHIYTSVLGASSMFVSVYVAATLLYAVPRTVECTYRSQPWLWPDQRPSSAAPQHIGSRHDKALISCFYKLQTLSTICEAGICVATGTLSIDTLVHTRAIAEIGVTAVPLCVRQCEEQTRLAAMAHRGR